MEYLKIYLTIILTFLIILLYYFIDLFYISYNVRLAKNGKKVYKLKSLYDIRIVLLLIIVLPCFIPSFLKFMYYNSFPDFEIEVSDNINDIDFNKLYEEIKKNLHTEDDIYVVNQWDYSDIVIDKEGKIESFKISFMVPKLGYSVYYLGHYKENKMIFKHHSWTFYNKDDTYIINKDNLLSISFSLLNDIDYNSILTFSNSHDDIIDDDVTGYKLILEFYYNEGYPSKYTSDFRQTRYVLESDGNIEEGYYRSGYSFIGVINIYCKTIDSEETNQQYKPSVSIFKIR